VYDIVIRGGTIVDGTGAPPVAGDLAVDGDRIVAVGAVDGRGREEIDADGAVVTPGFLDLHTHYDGQVAWDPHSVSGLSDAGAHVTMISDCSTSTFQLTHWVRDRTKGERVPLELAVHKLTGAPAGMYGFADRGVLEPGRKADVNVIDFDNLSIQAPYTRADLPTGASRILQPSTGYVATMTNGQVVRRHDEDTGARPGHLLRSGRGER
jgi:N-acyl-D-aspartate/D-glutamate deacylase